MLQVPGLLQQPCTPWRLTPAACWHPTASAAYCPATAVPYCSRLAILGKHSGVLVPRRARRAPLRRRCPTAAAGSDAGGSPGQAQPHPPATGADNSWAQCCWAALSCCWPHEAQLWLRSNSALSASCPAVKPCPPRHRARQTRSCVAAPRVLGINIEVRDGDSIGSLAAEIGLPRQALLIANKGERFQNRTFKTSSAHTSFGIHAALNEVHDINGTSRYAAGTGTKRVRST